MDLVKSKKVKKKHIDDEERNNSKIHHIDEAIGGFVNRYIMQNMSIVVIVTLLLGLLLICINIKSTNKITIIIFVMTQVIGAYAVIFQLKLKSKSEFKSNLAWNTYEVLSESYESIGKLDNFAFNYVSTTIDRIKYNPGVNFGVMIVNKEENSYMIDYRKRLGEYISDIYSVAIPVELRLSVYLKDRDLRSIKEPMERIKDSVNGIMEKYTETEKIWREISKKQFEIKPVPENPKKKKSEMTEKELERLEKKLEKIEKVKKSNSKINETIKKEYYMELKDAYNAILEHIEELSGEQGYIELFEKKLKSRIEDHRLENKVFNR